MSTSSISYQFILHYITINRKVYKPKIQGNIFLFRVIIVVILTTVSDLIKAQDTITMLEETPLAQISRPIPNYYLFKIRQRFTSLMQSVFQTPAVRNFDNFMRITNG